MQHEVRAWAAALEALGWRCTPDGRLSTRTWSFSDFAEAFAFLTRVAAEAERIGHHPDWRQSYGTVEISLTTHDAGHVTVADVALAQAIESVMRTAE